MLQRTYNHAHAQRIGALAWNAHVLSSGSRDRLVLHRDVRVASHKPFRKGQGHRQEVCGLKWSGDGGPGSAALASGGNDNKVCIWDLRGTKRGRVGSSTTSLTSGVGSGPGGSIGTGTSNNTGAGPSTGGTTEDGGDVPLWKFHEHTAAVKALAWDPHISGVLATGGGTQDKHIRFWNVGTGTMLNELDTGSQVCFLPRFSLSQVNVSIGLQSCLVAYFTRTRVNPWFLIHHCPESDMHMEVSNLEHGCIAHRTYESCIVPGHESGWRDHRDWCR